MFFIFSKIFYFLLSPYTWLLIALFIFIFSKREKLKKISKYSLIVIAIFFTNSFVHKEFIRLWEIPSVNISEVENYDVGVVLGGMFNFDNSAKRLSIRRGGDRIWQALNLYYAGKIKKILISGDSGYVTDRGLHEANQLKEVLVKWGIPSKDLIVEPYSKNTYENAVESVRLLKNDYPKLKRVLLITSSKHMRRAKACFVKQELDCDMFSTDQYTGGIRAYHWDEFIIPNAENFNHWHTLIKEWVGYISYKVMGYL